MPYFVRSIRIEKDRIDLVLSDATVEALDPTTLRVGNGDALYTKVKGGAFDAKFSRHAQNELAPALREDEEGNVVLEVGGSVFRIA